ncbi:MAG TPA: chemotaxis protein CheX [Candidatus Acidoferrum sp.]|nr:chemotaxis protein CheX [Candidatus Acidoferrum sp.]
MSQTMGKPADTHAQLDPHWKGILECAAIEVFGMMANAELGALAEQPEQPHGEQTAMVGLAGALCGMITIRCSKEIAIQLATQMMGEDAKSNPSMVGDALGELCNMVAGNFKSKITSLADHCMLSVPTVIWGEDYVMQTVQPHSGFQFALACDGLPVWFSLVTHN